MIELRWYTTDNKYRTLQYRQRVDTTVRAGMWDNAAIVKTANYEWSEWIDVPEVQAPPKYAGYPASNRCPKCGMEFNGPMGYVCPVPNCPTGLGTTVA